MPIRLITGQYYSVTEVSDKLGITRSAVLKAISNGRLKSCKFASVHLIKKENIEDFLWEY